MVCRAKRVMTNDIEVDLGVEKAHWRLEFKATAEEFTAGRGLHCSPTNRTSAFFHTCFQLLTCGFLVADLDVVS
ncbi:hypothetical protein QYF36_000990 [Acer negundo]|nr:hypothetical protein QYF36_000990 [Acer negundo]